MTRYRGRWGRGLTEAYLPQDIVKQGQIALKTPALAVLAVLLDSQKGQAAIRETYTPFKFDHLFATARIGRKTLIERTGYSVNVITGAIRQLKDRGWIEQSDNSTDDQRRKGGKFPCAEYTLMNPMTGTPLKESGRSNVILANRKRYFTFPKVVITQASQPWSLAQMSSSEKRVYFACAYLANEARSNEFSSCISAITTMTDVDPRTVTKQLARLENRGLVWITAKPDQLFIQMCDPYTGQPLHTPDEDEENNEVNYKATVKGVARRADLNLAPAKVEELVRSLASAGGPVTVQGSGDLMIRCPFHSDNTPSCSVSPSKRGIWQCFGCKRTGKLSDLIAQLTGDTKVGATAQIGKASGQEVYYQRPDSEALHIYSYRGRFGDLLKQVLRYPNDENGNKVIRQRRPAKGGWRWDVKGLRPMLYHANLLAVQQPDTVCIVEGEKDAETVTNIGLLGQSGPVIAVTSGGAHTWDPILAWQLRHRRVIVMSDNDVPGRLYAEQVKTSLKAEGIEFREVGFAGTGAKDVSDYLLAHSIDDLVELIGRDWVRMPEDQSYTETLIPPTDFNATLNGGIAI